jgi:single-strand DNA-binding protein
MNEISFAATGNLTTDPELRFTPAGRAVATIRFAVNSRRRSAGGDWVDQPASYFTGTVWGPMAEHVAESVKKGDRVLVQGALVTRTYMPSEGPRAGENLSRLEVEIDEIGPSLRWGTAQLTKPSRQTDHEPSA